MFWWDLTLFSLHYRKNTLVLTMVFHSMCKPFSEWKQDTKDWNPGPCAWSTLPTELFAHPVGSSLGCWPAFLALSRASLAAQFPDAWAVYVPLSELYSFLCLQFSCFHDFPRSTSVILSHALNILHRNEYPKLNRITLKINYSLKNQLLWAAKPENLYSSDLNKKKYFLIFFWDVHFFIFGQSCSWNTWYTLCVFH